MPDGDPSQTTALRLLVAAACLVAASGLPGLFLGWRSIWGERLSTLVIVVGSALGLAGGCLALAGTGGARVGLPSPFPGGRVLLGSDALTGFFCLPVFLVGGLGAIFASAYWAPRRHPRNGRRLRFCYGLLVASLAAITLARDGVSFLVAWEGMALTNFFLVTTEDGDPGVRRAGWLYLLYSHAVVLSLFALFLLTAQASGSFAFSPIAAGAGMAGTSDLRTAIFVVALVGFGIKAGIMPLHSWLPAAHAAAPSHVSALMSGVVIKMGIYGLVRFCGLLESPPAGWGMTLLVLGSLSAFFGVVFALAQHDLKRLLAFHSIENIGIILLGLGLAMVGRSLARPELVTLGMAGCLLHVWNHAIFKSLLFLGAGSVVHATGSRDLEMGGGLARRMPWTAALFLVGAVAICGLPPLNGLVSELFVYLGLVRSAATPGAAWAAAAAPVLAATGALAVACFVKVFGVVFLGTARSAPAERAHESPLAMRAPMAALALACVVIGVAPGLVAPALERATAAWLRPPLATPALGAVAPLGWISVLALGLIAAVALLAIVLAPARRRARARQPTQPSRDCGYAASSPRIQYTASSCAHPITSRFGWALRPRTEAPRLEELFPAPSRFHRTVDDVVLDGVLLPAARRTMRVGAVLRALPRGQLQRYILYILALLLPLLVWALAGSAAR